MQRRCPPTSLPTHHPACLPACCQLLHPSICHFCLPLYLNIWLFMDQLLSKQHLPDGLIRIEVFGLYVCALSLSCARSLILFYISAPAVDLTNLYSPPRSPVRSFLAPLRFPTAALSRFPSPLRKAVEPEWTGPAPRRLTSALRCCLPPRPLLSPHPLPPSNRAASIKPLWRRDP